MDDAAVLECSKCCVEDLPPVPSRLNRATQHIAEITHKQALSRHHVATRPIMTFSNEANESMRPCLCVLVCDFLLAPNDEQLTTGYARNNLFLSRQ